MDYAKVDTVQAHIVRIKNGQYEHLLLKRSDYSPLYPGIWQVITGNIEPCESPFSAALREMKEETGLVPLKSWNVPYLCGFYDAISSRARQAPVFGFLVDEKAKINLSYEHTEHRWLNSDEALQLLALPCHAEALIIFMNYVLNRSMERIFSIDKGA